MGQKRIEPKAEKIHSMKKEKTINFRSDEHFILDEWKYLRRMKISYNGYRAKKW